MGELSRSPTPWFSPPSVGVCGLDLDPALVPMTESPYEAEEVLQTLLTKYPDLIPGDEIDEDEPRRWLLVSDEMGVPDGGGGGNRWSLDHLFLDQDGVPTFIECKRSSDTRARREVVAQMLDYAANGTAFWSLDRIRERAAENAKERGRSLDEAVAELLGESGTAASKAVEDYWRSVEENLRAARVRLVFVADEIPKELRRLVEFLNEKMADVTVLAVEIKQYLGEGQRAVVPRVLGLTEAATAAKRASTSAGKKMITPDDFYASCTPSARTAFKEIEAAATEANFTVEWYTTSFSVRVAMRGRRLESFFRCHFEDAYFCFTPNLHLTPGEETELRKELQAFGVTTEGGGKKAAGPDIEGNVSADNAEQVVKMFQHLVQRVKEWQGCRVLI